MSAHSIATIKARLLAAPALIDVRAAAVRIIAKRHRCNEAQAAFRLDDLRDATEIDRVFKLVLPDVYRGAHESIFERVRQFFKAINDRFPVDWDYMDEEYALIEEDGVSYFDFGIMVCSLRPFHAWGFKENWAELPLAYKLADVLFRPEPLLKVNNEGEKQWAYFAKTYQLSESLKPEGQHVMNRELIYSCFEGHRSPLRYLPQVVRVLTYNTGCLFYDYDEEDGPPEAYEWSQEAVEHLSQQGEIASQIERKIKRLEKWLQASPAKRVEQACRLYRKFQRVVNDEKSKYRTQVRAAASGRALIDVF
jgi:hypothetical protein